MRLTIGTTEAFDVQVDGWGKAQNARRVSRLRGGVAARIRAALAAGIPVIVHGCPAYLGRTTRRVIESGGRFYTRMPESGFAGGAR